MDEPAPRFTPHRTPSTRWWIGAVLAGPLLWVLSLAVVAVVRSQSRIIGIGLLIAAASFLLAIALFLPSRRMRLHEEREADGAGRR